LSTANTRRWASAEVELGEDARDVLLDRPLGDHELLGDRVIGPPLRHQAEDLGLARREPSERVARAMAAEQVPHDLGV